MMNQLEYRASPGLDFENLVHCHYQPLFRFAFSLTNSEADASDLTQQTFYVWATKGSQLRDGSKIKSWLFTTLHRAFLQTRRRQSRFPHLELSEVEAELPLLAPERGSQWDVHLLLSALKQLDKRYQSAVGLFYLEDYSYREIARALDVPLGTVKSRIARGLSQLHEMLTAHPPANG